MRGLKSVGRFQNLKTYHECHTRKETGQACPSLPPARLQDALHSFLRAFVPRLFAATRHGL